MYSEAKRLLELFGVPYIEAPTEAEAQCAQLEAAALVDGVVTEDNDALLFGARVVYKHLFDQQYDVEVYSMDDVESEINLSRKALIALAHLLGSDYTDGVHGVGIVNAMETVAAFGEDHDGLVRFSSAAHGTQRHSSTATPNSHPHPPSCCTQVRFSRWVRRWRGDDGDGDEEVEGVDRYEEVVEEAEADKSERRKAFEKKHSKVRRNWVLPDGFPSRAVTDAYLKPVVDSSEAPLSWARPNLHGLREFCAEKFGWVQAKVRTLKAGSTELPPSLPHPSAHLSLFSLLCVCVWKADEMLLPMMAEIDKGITQSRIDNHFAWEKRFAKVSSARLASAMKLQNNGAPLPGGAPPPPNQGGGQSGGSQGGGPSDGSCGSGVAAAAKKASPKRKAAPKKKVQAKEAESVAVEEEEEAGEEEGDQEEEDELEAAKQQLSGGNKKGKRKAKEPAAAGQKRGRRK